VGRIAGRSAFWVLAGLHLAGCLHYFPLHEVFSGEPVTTGDFVQHWLESVHRAEFLRDGSVLGYSTRWSAGHVEGFGGLVTNKVYNLVVAVLPEALRPLGFNLTVLAVLWLFPPLVYAAARRFGHPPARAAIAMALAAACWHGSMLFRVFWRGGSPMFHVGAAAGVLAAALLYARWSDGEERPGLGRLIVAVAILPWIHAGAAIVFAIVAAFVWLATLRARGLRVVEVATIGVATVVANLPWLWPFLRHRELQRSLYYGIYVGGPEHLLFDFVRGPFHLGAGPREETAILAPLLLLAALAGGKLRDRTRLAPILFGSAAVFGILAYGGEALGTEIGSLQPYRFVVPLAILLSIAAAAFPAWLDEPRVGIRILAVAVALVALVGIADRLRIAGRAGDYLGAGLGEIERWALEALRAAAAPRGERVDGRVLLEGDWLVERVAGRPGARRVSYSFVAFEGRLDAELIGSPTMAVLTPAEDASFWVGKLFGKRIEAWSAEEFRTLCERYGIRWIVTLRANSTRAVEAFGAPVERITERDGSAVFRVALPPAAAVRSDGRWIEVDAGSTAPIIVPYHWNPLLVARPEAAVRPVPSGVLATLPFVELTPPRPGRYRIGIE
jgi:hypothetical protein